MNPRTKWLGLGAVLVFVLYGGDQLYRSQIEQPTANLNSELDGLSQKLQGNNDSQIQAKGMEKRFATFQERALPFDPLLARSAYQEWLLDLVEENAIQSASVDAAQPREIELRSRVDRKKKIKVGHTISYTLRGQATLAHWTDLLKVFRQSGHLHKIQSLAFNPIGAHGQLDGTLTIEVMSLTSATRKEQLSDWQWQPKESNQATDYQQFVRRNLFAKGFAKSLNAIELKAITFDRSGKAQAWFRLDEKNTVEPVTQDQQLPVALHDISVVEILPDKVLIHVNRDPYWITLGQTVGDVCNAQTDL
jgi:hypothetical protein